jgi:hypothetical protein
MIRKSCRNGPNASPAGWRFGIISGGIMLGGLVPGTQILAEEPTFADFPYVIYCEYEGIDHAYYFSQLGRDGHAIYLTPDRQVGAISIDGVAERVGGDRPGSCLDKTLDDLRAAGQAFDLPR